MNRATFITCRWLTVCFCLLLTMMGAMPAWGTGTSREQTNMERHKLTLSASGTSINAKNERQKPRKVKGANDEAYLVISSDGRQVTFYCDGKMSSRKGTVIQVKDYGGLEADKAKKVTQVTIDQSFAQARPTSTSRWFYSMTQITAIEGMQFLNTSETTDMNRMFCLCSSLSSLDLSRLDTSKATNMLNMFYNCAKLTILSLSNFDTSNVTDMQAMFYGCSSLTELDISSFKTSKVTNMMAMFYGCSKLKAIDLRQFDTSKTETMYGMFCNCSELTSLDLSNFNTEKVTNMQSIFYNCSKLRDINLRNFRTDHVTTMYGMFYNCSNLRLLYLDHFNTTKVTTMEHMFSKCSSLADIDVSSFDTSNVTSMEGMFSECIALNRIDVSNFSTSKVNNMRHTFNECTSLERLDLRNFDTSKVTNSSAMLDNCHSLSYLAISSTMDDLDAKALNGVGTQDHPCVIYAPEDFNFSTATAGSFQWKAGWFKIQQEEIYGILSEDHETITFVYDRMKWLDKDEFYIYDLDVFHNYNYMGSTIALENEPPFFKKVVIDPSCADARPTSTKGWFAGMENITSIEGLEYINTSEVTDMEGMFYYCTSLTNLDISHFNTSKVKNMASMFCGCCNLTHLEVSHFDTSKVEDMKLMFYNCRSLASLDVKNFDTSNVTNMRGMFMFCQQLESIDINHFNTAKVTNMSGMFEGCNLTDLDLTHFDTSNVTNMHGMFMYCQQLKKLDINHFSTAKVTNMSGMFSACSNLTDLDVTHFDTSNVTDMSGMFSDCSNLTKLDVTHFDTSNVKNMWMMFSGCSNIPNLDVSHFNTARVEVMNDMFYHCSKLDFLDLSHFNIKSVEVDPEIPIPGPPVPGGDYPTPYEPYRYESYLKREPRNQISRLHTTEEVGEGLGKTTSLLEGCTSLKRLVLSSSMEQLYGGDEYEPASCTDVGSQSAPCMLSVPDNFDFGDVAPLGTFQWKGGWFRLEAHPCSLAASAATLHPGGTSPLVLSLDNGNKAITAAQFDLSLPKGVTLSKESGAYAYNLGNRCKGMTLQIVENGEGQYRLMLLSLSGSTLSGSTGPIITLTLEADADLTDGMQEGRVKNILLTSPTYDSIHAYPVSFEVAVSSYAQGDVNHDGDVNVVDVMMNVNHVLKKDVPDFHPENADVDGSGAIDVVDVMGIVNIVLRKPAAAAGEQVSATANTF